MAEYIKNPLSGKLRGVTYEDGKIIDVHIRDTDDVVKVFVPVRHGRWERDEWGSYLRRCSVCKKSPVYQDERGNSVAVYAGVCINCGAKMECGNDG